MDRTRGIYATLFDPRGLGGLDAPGIAPGLAPFASGRAQVYRESVSELVSQERGDDPGVGRIGPGGLETVGDWSGCW